ncbi:hypothetical protein QQ045_008289 [Rhodiola kirilowii]
MAQHQQHSPDQIIEIPNDPIPLNSPPATAIVHLPAGQLYHRYPSTSTGLATSTVGTFRTILCWTLFVIIIVILSFLIFIFVFYIALRPKAPKFSIVDFIIDKSNPTNAGKCKIRLNADNPNAHMGLFVKHGGGGFAALYLNGNEIARGLPPDVYLRKSNTTSLEVLLEGLRDDGTSKDVWEKEMRFKMDVKVRLKLWLLKAWDMKMNVRCTFRASRQNSNGTHIMSQVCKDKIKF